jgi:hypothetical protein
VGGDWDVALRDAGVDVRDEGYSFLYVGDAAEPWPEAGTASRSRSVEDG